MGSFGGVFAPFVKQRIAGRARGVGIALFLFLCVLSPLHTAPQEIWVDFGTSMRYVANSLDPGLAMTWVSPTFDDTTWSEGPWGIGYEIQGGAEYLLQTQVPPGTLSIYTRATFDITDVTQIQSLMLGVDYDDGCVAYLNGTEIYRSPEMPTGGLTWDSVPALHESSNGTIPIYDYLDLTTTGIPLLVNGTNVLATAVWNVSASSTDAVLVARLLSNLEADLIRGPYLQKGTPDSIVVRWRTAAPTSSRVVYGTQPGSLTQTVEDPVLVTEHEIELTGLSPETRYYYSVGTQTEILAGDDADHFFVTSPVPGSSKPTRVWILGDSGTANPSAFAVRDAYYAFTGAVHTDLWLMLGDNAYNSGTDPEYQEKLFDVYPSMLRKSVLWPTLGNHDGVTANSSTQSGPYYDIFTLPSQAEAGGVPSGTEAYYSFDFANIHFVVLDSHESDRSVGGTMLTWLEQDLAATTQDWIIGYWHHPPYTKGSHDSDIEFQLVEMRENVAPILDDYGVDLILSGHSHVYERTFLMEGHYGTSDTFLESMKVDSGDGREDGDGEYRKILLGQESHSGVVYTVAGTAGRTTGGTLDHPAMYISMAQIGSVVLDVNRNRLALKFIDHTGTIQDYFTIAKGPDCPNDPDEDIDEDGICGDVDNCPSTPNPDQADSDADTIGDACDACPDDPADDADADGLCADADNCPSVANANQVDEDNDGLGDACDPCLGEPINDPDGDALCGDVDNCPTVHNPDQADLDQDLIGNVCDACPADPLNDSDGDGVCLNADNCPYQANLDQTDTDGDGVGDACTGDDDDNDSVINELDCAPQDHGVSTQPAPIGPTLFLDKIAGTRLFWTRPVQGHASNVYRGIVPAGAYIPSTVAECFAPETPSTWTTDGETPLPGGLFYYFVGSVNACGETIDRVVPLRCPLTQADTDLDGLLDVSDNCPETFNDGADLDHDFVGDACDNCPAVHNSPQSDADDDGQGDVCEGPDADGDGVPDFLDNCVVLPNPPQIDTDMDGEGNDCDTDDDGDGVEDTFDGEPLDPFVCRDTDQDGCDDCASGMDDPAADGDDPDSDGLCSTGDNCPNQANLDQSDGDVDGLGDACDACPVDPQNDVDADGVCGDIDNCPLHTNNDQFDADSDGTGDACDGCPSDPVKIDPGACGCGTPDDEDADSDTYLCDVDCDDTNASIHPGATETICDGLDNDCDAGSSDAPDLDGDLFDACGSADISNPDGRETDCDDSNLTVNPSVTEVCGDSVDNNCDGTIDDDGIGGFVWHADLDGDSFGDPAVSVSACEQPSGHVVDATDCDDTDFSVNPDATEICGDGINNDCSIVTVDIFDIDGDTFNCDVDCDETNPAVNPGAVEAICDGIDNDCAAGTPDADDADSDLHDVCGPGDLVDPDGLAADCNDADAGINPGAAEVPDDAIDQDCNGFDTITCFVDADKDGFGTSGGFCGDGICDPSIGEDCRNCGDCAGLQSGPQGDRYCCGAGGGFNPVDCSDARCTTGGFACSNVATTVFAADGSCDTAQGESAVDTDCNDADNTIHPGATEIPDNGTDEDCSGADAMTCYVDGDGDGYGAGPGTVDPDGTCDAGTSSLNTDCADADPASYPGASELCDGNDNDCDTVTPATEIDNDADAYVECTGWLDTQGDNASIFGGDDCDDDSGVCGASCFPGNPAADTCDTYDNDCDTQIDEDPEFSWYADVDGDGFGDLGSSQAACTQPAGYVSDGTDCDDDLGACGTRCFPGNPAADTCDTYDNDCDTQIDEDPDFTWYADVDGDGFGDLASSQAACTQPAGYVSDSTDCDDDLGACGASCFPGNPAADTCDTYDNDCDTQIDEDPEFTWYADVDGDGFGDLASSQVACTQPAGYVSDSTDCDDDLGACGASCFPGNPAADTCDTYDNDCDTQIDEDPEFTWYADVDGDGFGNLASSQAACTQPAGYASNSTDCDDGDLTTYPGASEVCDGNDNNCDTVVPATEIDNDTDLYVECTGWSDTQGDDASILGGDDCDDGDPDNWDACLTCVDMDLDTFYIGCDAYITRSGPDCDDTISTCTNNCVVDTDGDVVPDCGDPDDDNDGIDDGPDPSPLDPDVCGDIDSDTCDDCAVGTDDFGPLSDSDPANDGPDSNGDGICDAGLSTKIVVSTSVNVVLGGLGFGEEDLAEYDPAANIATLL